MWAAYGLVLQIRDQEMHSKHTMCLKVIDIIARTQPNYLVLQVHLLPDVIVHNMCTNLAHTDG